MPVTADPESQLEIDEWILDYLVFSAIKAVMEDHDGFQTPVDRISPDTRTTLLLQMVDSNLTMFRAMHSDHHCSPDLQFRLRLLKFALMFTRRNTSAETTAPFAALHKLRKSRRACARLFRSRDEASPGLHLPDLSKHCVPDDGIWIKREQVTQDTDIVEPERSLLQPPPPVISLMDTLPHFMTLSAAHKNMAEETTITNVWMMLAAGYMAHAAMEQYLLYGSERPDVLREAFAWGYESDCRAEDGSDEWLVNAMFCGEDEAVPEWDKTRDQHWRILLPPSGIDLRQHFENLMATDLPLIKFEENVMGFLGGLLHGSLPPVLVQVETGKIEGLSKDEMRAFRRQFRVE